MICMADDKATVLRETEMCYCLSVSAIETSECLKVMLY